MRIFILWERRNPPVPSPLLVDVVSRLIRDGFDVELARCDELLLDIDRLVPAHDLYLLKSHTPLALSVAAALHAQGARLLNPFPACAVTADKVRTARLLRAAGVPVPRTWATSGLTALRELASRQSLVIKPAAGLHGEGVRLIGDPAHLDQMPPPAGPLVVQRHVPGRGTDLKVYVAGEAVFATRKPFSSSSYARPGTPCAVDGEIRQLALRTGAAAGLGLFGVDIIEGPDGPVVVDLNYFPGYRGFPGAAAHVAEYVAGYARGQITLAPPQYGVELEPSVLAGVPGTAWVRASRPIASAGEPAQPRTGI